MKPAVNYHDKPCIQHAQHAFYVHRVVQHVASQFTVQLHITNRRSLVVKINSNRHLVIYLLKVKQTNC